MSQQDVEGSCRFEPDERVVVLGQAKVNSLDGLLQNGGTVGQVAILVENLHGPGSQEHDLVGELGDYVVTNKVGDNLLDFLATVDGHPELADQIHGHFLVQGVGAFQLSLEKVHIIVEKHSNFFALAFAFALAADIGKGNPSVHCHFLQIGVVESGVFLPVHELDGVVIRDFLIFWLQLHESQQDLVLKLLGVRLHDGWVRTHQSGQTLYLVEPGFLYAGH